MKFKKIISMMCVMGMLLTTVPVNAANVSDTSFVFDFNYLASVHKTDARKKENKSSTYIKAAILPTGGMEVRVEGSWSTSAADKVWTNETINGKAYITVTNADRRIRQWVYEHGHTYARLYGYKWSTEDAAGWWSPDCTTESFVSLN